MASLKRAANSADDELTAESCTAWKAAFRKFSSLRKLKLSMKRTALIHWRDYSEGFFYRESEEVIFRTIADEKKLYYSGDMFDRWTYFSPVETKDLDWFKQNADLVHPIKEEIQRKILNLAYSVKAADLNESPDSFKRSEEVRTGQGGQTTGSLIQPPHISYLYWEARVQGFHNLRGKLFAEAFLRLLFSGVEDVKFSYSTAGHDTHLDRWGYIKEGPTERNSGYLDSLDSSSTDIPKCSKEKLLSMIKNVESIEFDLKATSHKVTSGVFVTKGNDLVLIAEVANLNDIEQNKIQQLHMQMLLSLAKHKKLFGMLVQSHQVHLAEYSFDPLNGYKRSFTKRPFKYKKNHIELIYLYLRQQLQEIEIN